MLLQATSIISGLPEFLKYGLTGLGAILAVLAFYLIYREQGKPKPRNQILNSIYVFMGFSLLLFFMGLFIPKEKDNKPTNVVPEENKKSVSELPKASQTGDYQLIKDISIFDLRAWKEVPEDRVNEKVSPVSYINYLHVRKTKDIQKITAHYSTQGYDIDLRCITHNFKVYVKTPASSHHEGEKEYGIEIDVSKAKVGDEFLVLIEATYWNGFKNINKESAATYTDKEITGLEELSLIVLLPEFKPVKNTPKKLVGGEGRYREYREEDKFFLDEKKRFVYWSVKNIDPDMHYKLEWDW